MFPSYLSQRRCEEEGHNEGCRESYSAVWPVELSTQSWPILNSSDSQVVPVLGGDVVETVAVL